MNNNNNIVFKAPLGVWGAQPYDYRLSTNDYKNMGVSFLTSGRAIRSYSSPPDGVCGVTATIPNAGPSKSPLEGRLELFSALAIAVESPQHSEDLQRKARPEHSEGNAQQSIKNRLELICGKFIKTQILKQHRMVRLPRFARNDGQVIKAPLGVWGKD